MKDQTGPGALLRKRIRIAGAVQGVGFRPFVCKLAREMDLAGWVRNGSQGVEIEVEGPGHVLVVFSRRLREDLPPNAFITEFKESDISPSGETFFEIVSSASDAKVSVPVLADLAVCADCLREMNDSSDRRYRYPFITCTHCGPRFTIMTGLPYDRPQTTMADFPLCAQCAEEYENPLDRRFHAQPVACPECGPQIALWEADGREVAAREEALQAACEALTAGRILAVKGIGGFHLMCNARNEAACGMLRERKHRPSKPFAVMMDSIDQVKTYCEVSGMEGELLTSPQAPIVLLRRRGPHPVPPLRAGEGMEAVTLAASVAPGNPYLGVMLPCAPLHHLMMAELRFPLVATSGNRASEPICTDEREALERLCGIADLFLVHNRPIAHRCDDSIVRIMAGRPAVMRRARGYAPLPVIQNRRISESPKAALATGAHLKNTVALAVEGRIVLSPHIGDLDTPQAVAGHEAAIRTLCDLYRVEPETVAHDLHPDYYSTRTAGRVERGGLVPVQHHYAHALACMADNGESSECLAVCFDGTGYGLDGTVWGGEFLAIGESGFERFGHLYPFRLPGGDAAAREPWRVALSLLHEAGIEGDAVPFAGTRESSMVRQMIARNLNSPATTSAGRLFDGVAALLGLCRVNTFEGEAAMALEFAAAPDTDEVYPWALEGGVLDWRPMLCAMQGDDGARAARKFHNTLAKAVVEVAKQSGFRKICLTGGCFQNKLLLERTVHSLVCAGFEPLWHWSLPPNDGGIAAGQIIATMRNEGR
ncbi:MAG: carbamoyltransferase HypF [Alphaproteobacteria bacterium]|nr:carbamoyltransferase HypF [Alphaproteobacteria bacterium]